jgi:phosphoserine aminotransferase
MTKNIEVNLFDLIYASTQKVLGPTGLSIVIIKRNLAERAKKKNLPAMLDYTIYIYEKSMYNTPPTFSIYLLMLITDWLLEQGGIEVMDRINTVKSEVIYECLDSSNFYNNFIESSHRSRVNIVFKLPTEKLDEMFLKEAEKIGLIGLRGHRAVGGIRASMYNAMPLEGVETLVDFMYEFEKKHG